MFSHLTAVTTTDSQSGIRRRSAPCPSGGANRMPAGSDIEELIEMCPISIIGQIYAEGPLNSATPLLSECNNAEGKR